MATQAIHNPPSKADEKFAVVSAGELVRAMTVFIEPDFSAMTNDERTRFEISIFSPTVEER